jgi:4-hydroxy-2-oxoheptanedioate aldolase
MRLAASVSGNPLLSKGGEAPVGEKTGRCLMELPSNPFKRAIASGKPQIGCWSSLFSNYTVEVLATAGFDWLLLDMEHSPNEVGLVLGQLQATVGGTAHPVVRPPWNDMVVIKRLLDVGAQSFLIPYVQNADEARHAVAATRYPPRGVRGVSISMRANRFGRVPDYHARCEEEICVLLQVETREGLKNL